MILIIGQIAGFFSMLQAALEELSKDFIHLNNLSQMKEYLSSNDIKVIILGSDQNISDIKNIKDTSDLEGIQLIVCDKKKSSSYVSKIINEGADYFLPLPFETDLLKTFLKNEEKSQGVLHKSESMAKILSIAKKVAGTFAQVLLTGESGTGKEVIARFIHAQGKRKEHPFIAINCAAIPEKLLESELFGYKKGAFTGAIKDKKGKFEQANKGVLFLDEISEMDLNLQSKILRAIQEKEIDTIGGTVPIKTNVQIIASSNKNLREQIKESKFREDLFFRLSVIELFIPPLRERKEDIELLANHFIKAFSKDLGVPCKKISKHARDLLIKHEWPGNVRELENCIHRSILLEDSEEINGEYFFSNYSQMIETQPRNILMKGNNVEINKRMDKGSHFKRKRQTANIIGLSIKSLSKKMGEEISKKA